MPAQNALRWYADAMRLWKRGPAAFCGLAFVILAVNLSLSLVPVAGVVAAQLVVPPLECALLYASLAADRGDRPRFRHLLAIAAAPAPAIAAVIAAGLVVFCAEALVGRFVGGIDMLAPGSNVEAISGTSLAATYAAGVAMSLPVAFVPFAALFDGAGFSAAFRQSAAGFARNVAPLALYGALSFGLLMLGLATSLIGLLLALPWSAAASYAAWKDIYSVA